MELQKSKVRTAGISVLARSENKLRQNSQATGLDDKSQAMARNGELLLEQTIDLGFRGRRYIPWVLRILLSLKKLVKTWPYQLLIWGCLTVNGWRGKIKKFPEALSDALLRLVYVCKRLLLKKWRNVMNPLLKKYTTNTYKILSIILEGPWASETHPWTPR